MLEMTSRVEGLAALDCCATGPDLCGISLPSNGQPASLTVLCYNFSNPALRPGLKVNKLVSSSKQLQGT